MEWMILPLKRYAKLSGRSPRRELWMFVLFIFIVSTILGMIDALLGLGDGLPGIWSFLVLIPLITVAVRRLHDIGRSGWWMLAPFLVMAVAMVSALGRLGFDPDAAMFGFGIFFLVALFVAGAIGIAVLVSFCIHGTRGPNRFGPDPYAAIDDLHETFR